MKLLKHHVYAIQNIINRGTKSSSANYTNSYVAHLIKAARSILLKRNLLKYRSLSPNNYQTLCVSLEVDTFHDCPSAEDLGCKVLKSTCTLPQDIRNRNLPTIEVTNINNKVIPYIGNVTIQYKQYSLTGTNRYGWYLDNGKLVIVGTLDLKLVLVKAIWEDPEEASSFSCSGSEVCKQFQSDLFPIDPELVMPMYQMVLEFLGVSYKLPQDNVTDLRSPELLTSLDPNEMPQ